MRAFKASEVIVWIRHSLFLVSSWVLRDRFEFEYRLDHLFHVTLVCSCHSMSLTCFLFKVFVFLFWLDTSFHFVDTYSMLWDMFMIILFLHCTPIMGSVPHFFVEYLIQFFNSMLIFSLRKGERRIFISTLFFFRDLPWSPYHFFSYGAQVESWVKDMCL